MKNWGKQELVILPGYTSYYCCTRKHSREQNSSLPSKLERRNRPTRFIQRRSGWERKGCTARCKSCLCPKMQPGWSNVSSLNNPCSQQQVPNKCWCDNIHTMEKLIVLWILKVLAIAASSLALWLIKSNCQASLRCYKGTNLTAHLCSSSLILPSIGVFTGVSFAALKALNLDTWYI